jgi:hypothetical protein
VLGQCAVDPGVEGVLVGAQLAHQLLPQPVQASNDLVDHLNRAVRGLEGIVLQFGAGGVA